MKKRIISMVMILILSLSMSVQASTTGDKEISYKAKVYNTSGKISISGSGIEEDVYIIRSYKELKKVKARIKKVYWRWHAKEQIRKLKKYNKKFFKKNALCYAAVLYNGDAFTKLSKVVKNNKKLKLYIDIDRISISATHNCVVEYNYDTFLLTIKKKNIKGVKKVKIKRNYIKDTKEVETTTGVEAETTSTQVD